MFATLFELGCIGACAGAVIHSLKNRSWRRTFALFALPFLASWAMEVHNMWASGGYFYPLGSYALWLPGGFPLAIACGWALTVYIGFLVMRRFRSLKLGVLAGAGIDVLLEPMAFYFGLWVWMPTGNPLQEIAYFGAPAGNLLGWLLFVTLMLLIFKRFMKE